MKFLEMMKNQVLVISHYLDNPKEIKCLRVVFLLGCLFASAFVHSVQWQMPLAHEKSNFQTQLALSFAEQVKQQTNSRLIITIHPSQTLYKGEQIFGAIRNNLVPIGARLASALDHEDLLLQLDALPFLAKNYLEAFNLYKASKELLEKRLREKGVKLLYAIPWPAQGLYSRSEITQLADLKDKKFRPYSQLTASLGEKLGLVSSVMPLNKVAKALKKKQLDVMFASPLNAAKWRFSAYFPYWYELQAWLPKEIMVVNIDAWNSLSVEDQKSVLNIAKRIEIEGWAKSKQVNESGKLYLQNAGVQVAKLPFELQREIEVVGLSIVQQWLAKMGDQGRYLLERYIKLSPKLAK
jgi:TRAP-type C4-dicarboxylate transport system substrate-binding protein